MADVVAKKTAGPDDDRWARVQRQKEALRHMAGRCNLLADALTQGGTPLSEHESQLLRMAQLPTLKDEFDAALMSFVVGRPLTEILDNLNSLIKGL